MKRLDPNSAETGGDMEPCSARNGTENRGILARISHHLARKLPLHRASWQAQQPIVSFTFDDFPDSAAVLGAQLLEDAGGRGTYYASSSLLGTQGDHWQVANAEQLLTLAERGHEIGLHTHSHTPIWALSKDGIDREIRLNRQMLQGLGLSTPLNNFAYPYGLATFMAKRRLARCVRSSRSVERGLNYGWVDRHYLLSIELVDARLTLAELAHWMTLAHKLRAWVIFVTHDVGEIPSPYGCSPHLLRAALDHARHLEFTIATVQQALDLGGIP